MEQMAGIFIVFAAGIGLGLICMVFEYIFAAYSDGFRDRLEGVSVELYGHFNLFILFPKQDHCSYVNKAYNTINLI